MYKTCLVSESSCLQLVRSTGNTWMRNGGAVRVSSILEMFLVWVINELEVTEQKASA